MKVVFSDNAWEVYQALFLSGDKRAIRKIHALIDDIKKNGLLVGIGKPEKLRYRDNEYSREINDGDRLVYTQDGDSLIILSCRKHYDDK